MKVSRRFCRHCKSPARGNPCWNHIRFPRDAEQGFDPPCVLEDYAAEARRREQRWSRNWLVTLSGLTAAALALWVFT